MIAILASSVQRKAGSFQKRKVNFFSSRQEGVLTPDFRDIAPGEQRNVAAVASS